MKFTTPLGKAMVIEPFTRFILSYVFRKGMVECVVLLPKGNGKTLLFAALAVYHLLITPNAQCFIVAADKEQADELYRFAQHFVTSTPALRKRMYVRESTRRIRSKRDTGFIKVIASDKSKAGGKKHSFNPTLALIDELHAHENDNAYTAMRTAAFKADGLVLNCSTAGHDHESTLGLLRAGMLKLDQQGGRVRHGLKIDRRGRCVQHKDGRLSVCESRTRGTVMLAWECRKDDNLDDPKVVKLANPASWVSEASIVDARETPGITPWSFARYRANVWTLAYESWLPELAFERLAVAKTFDESPYTWATSRRRTCITAPPRLGIDEGDDLFTFVDMGRYRDTAAIVCVAPPRGNEQPAAWLSFVEKSGGVDHPIDYEPVMQAHRDLDNTYRLLAAGWDPKYFDHAATELEGEGLPMFKFEQSNARMCPATANLREAILREGIRHDGDPILIAHVIAGAVKDVGPDEYRLVKAKSGGQPIDGGVALAGAHQLAFFREKQPVPFVEVIR
jgi:hypothetical protein